MFGAPQALTDTVNVVADAVDKFTFTDQEKAAVAQAELKAARAATVEWMRTTKGQNLARRYIALFVTWMWGFMLVSSILLRIAGFEHAAAAIEIHLPHLARMMMLVLGFYFAAPHLAPIAKAFSRGKADANARNPD